MKCLWPWLLASLVAGQDDPPGWDYSKNMTWSQVANFSQWDNGTYSRDGSNTANVRAPISRTPETITLTSLYDINPLANISTNFIRVFFVLNEPCCITIDSIINSVESIQMEKDPPYFFADYSTNTPGWPFRGMNDVARLMEPRTQIYLVPPPGHAGWFSIRVEYQLDPWDEWYPSGSGSSIQLTGATIKLGRCIDVNEDAVLYGIMGAFGLFLILLILLLVKLHKRKKGGRYNVPIATLWHMLDLITDLVFAYFMNIRGFPIASALSLFFTALPLFMHTLMGAFLFIREMRLQPFSEWYAQNRCHVNILLGLMPILGSNTMTLMGSKLGGLTPLCAPFSDRGAYLVGMGTLITTTLEDIPQICIQVFTAIQTKELSSIVILSVSVSLLTVLFRLVRMIFDTFHYFGKQGLPGVELGGVGGGMTAFSPANDSRTGATKWGDWLELYDNSSQMWYYENTVTGTTTWDKPQGWVVTDVPAATDKIPKRCHERRRFQWPVTIAFTFFSIGMCVRYVIDPQNFQ